MRSFRTLGYVVTGLLAGLAAAVFIVVICTMAPPQETSGLALAGLFLLLALPTAGAILGGVLAKWTRRGPPP